MLHISDVKRFNRCPFLYVKSKEEPSVFNSFVRLDEEITTLAADKLEAKEYFQGYRSMDCNETLEAMDHYDWIMKGRFEADGLRIKVPFLHRHDEGWDLYFLFCGNIPKEDDLQFYVDTVYVLEKNKIVLKDYYMIHFNKDYVRGDELDPKELFLVSTHFYTDKGNPARDLKEAITRKMVDLKPTLDQIIHLDTEELGSPVRMPKCSRKSKCMYYQDCFPEEETMEDDSILTLISSQHKYAMKREGMEHLRDVDLSRLEGSRLQYAQIMADINGGCFIDKMAVRSWMGALKYPLIFLDFEWDTYAIPPYKGMSPFGVALFEYSIHIMDKQGKVEHKDYIGIGDCREALIQGLINDIPSKGTIIAYNAEGAEKLRLQELAQQFPVYESKLMGFHKRFMDLQVPFAQGMIYDTRMKGLFSLKVLMNILDDEGYKALDIHQGMDAVFEWRRVDRHEDADSEKILNDLKAYCGMDTYAMIVVFKWILKLLDSEF
ncbi:MAG: DUF2779 domain-containing protein [Erysipelotrichaceae bacterium]|nr:DUF2779 domain-containing protein [Erysipelotrichaceae bacterium]